MENADGMPFARIDPYPHLQFAIRNPQFAIPEDSHFFDERVPKSVEEAIGGSKHQEGTRREDGPG